MNEVIAIGLMILGTFFVFVGSLGVLRFEDVYLRLQASSKSLTFGLGFVVLGAAVWAGGGWVFSKAVLIIVFQFITSPIAAQVIARAAMRRGIVPAKLVRIARPAGAAEQLPPEDEQENSR